MGIAAMIASIKFNDRRNKRETFRTSVNNTKIAIQGIRKEQVSEDVLKKIRQKLKKQQEVLFKKRLIAFGIFILFISSLVVYVSI